MARAFQAAVASIVRTPAASPLPSSNKNTTTAGLANLQWLLSWKTKRATACKEPAVMGYDDDESASMFASPSPYYDASNTATPYYNEYSSLYISRKQRRGGGEALTRLRSAVLAVLARARWRGGRRSRPLGSCACVTGTIFGRRRGHVHVALQTDPRSPPALMLELTAYSTGALVREMASGIVRLALECERTPPKPPTGVVDHKSTRRPRQPALVEEPTWRAYCNGRKCGYAVRRDCGADDWRVLRAVEPVSVGAGVIPDDDGAGGVAGDGDMMYMRAKFDRVVGSKDSEAFYMVNPDDGGRGGPELSIYLLRV